MADARIPVQITIDPRLTHMLKMQRDLQRMYNKGREIEDFTSEERMVAIRDNVLACTDELHEALGETGWKPWATSNHINTQAFWAEMVDAWHFFMNLMLHSGMTADDLYRGYLAKHDKNIKRQEDAYDGVTTKCPGCKRAYDDDAVECNQPSMKPIGRTGWCVVKRQFV
jgi:phosphoribosyl-ATP pyrophosphohydrolase